MEVNKEEAARCRDLGAAALKSNQYARAIKMFNKSLHLYPLPGVKALLGQAERKLAAEGENRNTNTTSSATNGQQQSNGGNSTHSSSARSTTNGTTSRSSSTTSLPNNSTHSSTTSAVGADGRQYTTEQLSIVTQVLKARSSGGRSVHYKVLCIERNADDSAIKKAYRKLALKLHPDKNSAPKADEAFKAVGLAYATLSDTQKRRIYDVSGEEDPDNRGGGMRRGGGGGANMHFHGQDVSPEDIFNMFFGGGMQGGGMGGMGGPGFRVYSSGFGQGFGAANMRQQQQQRRRQQQQQQNQQPDHPLGQLLQFLPLLLIMALSFFNMPGDTNGMGGATGGNRYFSLTPVKPHINPLSTRLTKVKDIPYYVSDSFLRTVARDRYQLSQVERMVERSYSTYLIDECKNQKAYKRKLELLSTKKNINDVEKSNLVKKANGFVLSRCMELEDLFPESVKVKDRVDRSRQHSEF